MMIDFKSNSQGHIMIMQDHQKQRKTQTKQGCPGGGSAADCALEACGSLRSSSARAFDACKKECLDRCVNE